MSLEGVVPFLMGEGASKGFRAPLPLLRSPNSTLNRPTPPHHPTPPTPPPTQEVPLLLSDHGWDLTARAGAHSLHHATCPWGGRLLKVKASVPSEGFVRPEAGLSVRGQ